MARVAGASAILVLALLLVGCTSIGFHSDEFRRQIDFGAHDSLALCLYLDTGISERQARALIDEAWREEAGRYGLQLRLTQVTRWPRPAYTMDGIIDGLLRLPLTPECDRVFALVNRHVGDFVWGLTLLPEVLGAVNDETLTHGYAIVRRVTLNQLFVSPAQIVRHELYHLLGCDAHFNMRRCYEQIAALKRSKQARYSDFLPAWDLVNQRMLLSRDDVNARLRAATDRSGSALGAR